MKSEQSLAEQSNFSMQNTLLVFPLSVGRASSWRRTCATSHSHIITVSSAINDSHLKTANVGMLATMSTPMDFASKRSDFTSKLVSFVRLTVLTLRDLSKQNPPAALCQVCNDDKKARVSKV